uniref:protein translocase subunit SecD n=1 Tax=Thaumasiovibrio occultus TaxID=1891184 RepID=UPI000B354B14|nr:protein translocase subunit SecD [Thaumasiovibrio occultus]
MSSRSHSSRKHTLSPEKGREQTRLLNHYPLWKYVVLIVTVIVLTLSALPTWYGEKPAILLSSEKFADLNTLHQFVEQHELAPLQIEQKDDTFTLIFNSEDQQAAAKEQFTAAITPEDSLTYAYVSIAPNWLSQMGFAPIKLGLDLRGGVQFLLNVDIDTALKDQRQALMDSLTEFVHREQLRGTRISDNGTSVDITTRSDSHIGQIREFLSTIDNDWTVVDTPIGFEISAAPAFVSEFRNEVLLQNLATMRDRIEELGITEASVQRQGEQGIRIELPGVQDPSQAKNVIGATASLAFYEVKTGSDAQLRSDLILPDEYGEPVRLNRRPIITGEHIVNAQSSVDEMGMPEVGITLDSAGGDLMSTFSKSHINQPMATVYREYHTAPNGSTELSEKVISIATIQTQLGSQFRITGVGTSDDAQQLALLLRAGSLTAPVTIVEERTIGASLGAENISNGFSALALGLVMTLIFMALWYRRLGWVANAALLMNMLCLLGLIALIPGSVLTLPGIAGIVLTVGMAVDTNVLIYERIRDKMAEGRPYALAIDAGFNSAFKTIFDANLTTMITAVVLYTMGSGPIKGFALTLGLGLLTSMFTGIFASRAIINLVWGKDTRRDVRI